MLNIIASAYNRSGVRVDNFLKSLNQQSLRRSLYTITVVDYGSSSGHADNLRRICKDNKANYIFVETEKWFSRSRALNIGIRRSRRQEYILCTDVDIVFHPGCLQRVYDTLLSDENKFIVADCYGLSDDYTDVPISNADFEELRSKARKFDENAIGALQAFSKKWIEKVRGFDESMEVWGAEDTDLQRRALDDGLQNYRIVDCPVLHQPHKKWQETIKDWGLPEYYSGPKWQHNVSKVGTSITKNTECDWGQDTLPKKLSGILISGEESDFHIEGCVGSLVTACDEVIFINTLDDPNHRIVQTAKKFGDKVKVFHHPHPREPWHRDYSVMRNMSLCHAEGEWCFFIDIDERIDKKDAANYRILAENSIYKAFTFHQKNYFPDWYEGPDVHIDNMHVKMFKRIRGIKFDGHVHEGVLLSLRAAGHEDKIAVAPFKTYHHAWRGNRQKYENKRHHEGLIMNARGKPHERLEVLAYEGYLPDSSDEIVGKIVENLKGATVLDLGGGTGKVTLAAARKGFISTCADYSELQLNKAINEFDKHPEIKERIGTRHVDGENLDSGDRSFDTVVLANTVGFSSFNVLSQAVRVASKRVVVTLPIEDKCPAGFRIVSSEIVDNTVVLVIDKDF